MFVLLVGPKGSGKSHVGRLLEARCGVHFMHVEPLWMRYHAACRRRRREPTIAEGIAVVHPEIERALARYPHVSVETTGASGEILAALLTLAPRSQTLIVRVRAPLAVCLERIERRDARDQIPMEPAQLAEVHALSEACVLDEDLRVENTGLDDCAILAQFAAVLPAVPGH